ncbi:unnamed protein product [Symbiodinium sp. CCMP2592]|nr:unnamed protein product [Symbiodinium sp. CCMP2592]
MEKEGELCDLRSALFRPAAPDSLCSCSSLHLWQGGGETKQSNLCEASTRTRHHPMYGRNLSQDDWPELSRLIDRARGLPSSSSFRVAALIEGEEDVYAKEVALWKAGADVFQLTFKTVRADTLFFPNSMIAEGRNYLFAAASYVELQMGYRYTYYCYFDADTALENWHVGWHSFESFLREWEPAVGLPSLDGYSSVLDVYRKEDGAAVRTVLNFDHTVEAVHSDAAFYLLPYVLDLDEDCQWVSQWRFASLATALFPEHVLLTHDVLVQNTAHGHYSREYCLERMMDATLELRAKMPKAASCFVEPRNEALSLNGKLRLSAYLPWAKALKRTQAEKTRQNYTSPEILSKLRGCEDLAAVRALSQQADHSWCRGCPTSMAFAMLQYIVVQRPMEFVGWLRLADFTAAAVANRDELLISEMCLSVAVRMLRCIKGIDGSRVSWKELKKFHAAHVEFGIHVEPNEETVQEIERLTLTPSRRDTVIAALRLALTPQGDLIEPVSLMSDDKIGSLVDWLFSCPTTGGA